MKGSHGCILLGVGWWLVHADVSLSQSLCLLHMWKGNYCHSVGTMEEHTSMLFPFQHTIFPETCSSYPTVYSPLSPEALSAAHSLYTMELGAERGITDQLGQLFSALPGCPPNTLSLSLLFQLSLPCFSPQHPISCLSV